MKDPVIKKDVKVYYDIPFDDKTYLNKELGNHAENWPVTYILYNKSSSIAYVGETTNFKNRMFEHNQDINKNEFNRVLFIDYAKATKSTILSMEAFLIRCMKVSGEYFSNVINIKQNSNKHNYYHKEEDNEALKDVWDILKNDVGIANFDYQKIIEKKEFKYSPYVSLNDNQSRVLNHIVDELTKKKRNKILVEGASGTGKSILAIQLFKAITDYSNANGIINDSMIGENIDKVIKINNTFCSKNQKYRVAYIAPMRSFCTTLKKSLKGIPGLRKKDLELNGNYINEYDLELSRIYSGKNLNHIIQEYYNGEPLFDLVIVDEAHRLNHYKNLSGNVYECFQIINKKLCLPCNKNEYDGNQAEWIERISKNQIYFYDESQSIKSSDISKETFDKFFSDCTCKEKLQTQERCLGGEKYINYIRDILYCRNPKKCVFDNYEFNMFDSLEKMVESIHSKSNELALLASGYDFENSEIIDGKEYTWNNTNGDWVNSKKQDNEIGCIYVLGGVEADYLGVIIGNELYYDKSCNEIRADKKRYLSNSGKRQIKDEQELNEYIRNIYYILLTRGMKGTYVYVKNPDLKGYLKKYINII